MTTEEPSDKLYLEKLIEQSIQSKGSHYDIAMIIYFIYKNDYKVNNDKWYKKMKNLNGLKWKPLMIYILILVVKYLIF